MSDLSFPLPYGSIKSFPVIRHPHEDDDGTMRMMGRSFQLGCSVQTVAEEENPTETPLTTARTNNGRTDKPPHAIKWKWSVRRMTAHRKAKASARRANGRTSDATCHQCSSSERTSTTRTRGRGNKNSTSPTATTTIRQR